MKIQLKINLVSLGILVAVATAITVAGILTIEGLSFDLNRKLLSTGLDTVYANLSDAQQVLVDSGVAKAPSYVTAAQKEVLERLKLEAGTRFGHLSVISAPNKVVLHETLKPGDPLDLECLPGMFLQSEGVEECAHDGQNWLHYYRVFQPWDWMIIISASTQEMLAMRTQFLRSVLAIMAVSLVIGGIILVALTRGMVAPVQQLAKAALGLSRGKFDEPLPMIRTGDEIAELTNSFRVMSENLSAAHRDLEKHAQELAEANQSLNQEVAERKSAQKQLADLNRHLEEQVQSRTRDLAAKASELEEANRCLLEMDELKSDFLSSVSHELRTPLTSVLGFARVIHKDFARHLENPDQKDFGLRKKGDRILKNLEIINHEGQRLTRMINDLLDLAKIESGRLDWSDQDLELADIIKRSVDSVRPSLGERPVVRLEVDCAETGLQMCADPDRIEQVFINLLNNAIKFTEQGTIRVAVSVSQTSVEVTVSDSGTGISPEQQTKIFDRFHQVISPDTRRNKPTGTGLGLAICKQIVEHYKGRIWVESEPGKGSSFHVLLPLGSAED